MHLSELVLLKIKTLEKKLDLQYHVIVSELERKAYSTKHKLN